MISPILDLDWYIAEASLTSLALYFEVVQPYSHGVKVLSGEQMEM
jgi:hypothetical protein